MQGRHLKYIFYQIFIDPREAEATKNTLLKPYLIISEWYGWIYSFTWFFDSEVVSEETSINLSRLTWRYLSKLIMETD